MSDNNNITQEAIDLIKRVEGLSYSVYKDSGGIPTIGYGHTLGVTMDTPRSNREQVETWLRGDIARAVRTIQEFIKTPLSANQLGALASLVFNLGSAPLTGTLGKLLNAGDYKGASNEFGKWVYTHINGKAVRLKGLIARREDERQLFLK